MKAPLCSKFEKKLTVNRPFIAKKSLNSSMNGGVKPNLSMNPINTLKQCPCDGGCPSCGNIIQPALKVGQPNDKYEQEADQVAEEVMRMPEPSVSRQIEEEDEIIQTKCASNKVPEVIPQVKSHVNAKRDGGRPLPEPIRTFFDRRFGYDFSNVRIHINSEACQTARRLNAHAFTVGNDIIFGIGKYRPNSMVGMRLLAHELTHVVQQIGTNAFQHNVMKEEAGSPSLDDCRAKMQNNLPKAHKKAIGMLSNTITFFENVINIVWLYRKPK